MKNLYYMSDLHLEFRENRKSFSNKLNRLNPESNSILILSGDINFYDEIVSDKLLRKACEKFESAYLICGNHEFYNSGDMSVLLNPLEVDYGYVKIINNKSIKVEDFNVIFSSMFSKISPVNEFYIRRGMNDFNYIKFNGKSLSVSDYNLVHDNSVEFIKSEIIKNEKNIVVTHHLPSELLIQPRFKGAVLNEAFYVNLHDFIYDNTDKIKYWIYGHNHANPTENLKIERTELVTNQFGYSMEGLKGFDYNKHIKL